MKIERLETTEGFKPITIKILVESKDELEVLKSISGLVVTIPSAVKNDSGCDASNKENITYNFLHLLRGRID